MSDQQLHTDPAGNRLHLARVPGGALELRVNHRTTVPAPAVVLDPIALLAMIDTLAPDAMRTYLAETIPEVTDDPAAGTVTPEELDAVPEADTPEDDAATAEAWHDFTDAVRDGSFGADR